MEILSRLVESQQHQHGPLKKVLVVGDIEQTVFSDVLGKTNTHPLDLLPTWMPSVAIQTRHLDINFRCPHTHVNFNNLAMPRNTTTNNNNTDTDTHTHPSKNNNNNKYISLNSVKPSPELATHPHTLTQSHKPYLFPYVQSSSTVQNYDAYRTACRIAEIVLTLLDTYKGEFTHTHTHTHTHARARAREEREREK